MNLALKKPQFYALEQASILVVEDDRATLMLLEQRLKTMGHEVYTARNGVEAFEIVQHKKDGIDVILLDRHMPIMNGMQLILKLKADNRYKHIPVIMQTGADSPEEIKEGIEAGVFYYLTKPVNEDVLYSVLSGAIREATQQKNLKAELRQHQRGFKLIETCRFYIRTLTDAEDLAVFMANWYPEPVSTLRGLSELLVNAVEHGNLAVGYEEKTRLVATASWRQEIERRLELPENQNKRVEVVFQQKEDGLYVQINDEGEGFNWRRFMDIDPARAMDNHGRGIAQANKLSFDKMRYNDKGNQVVAVVYSHDKNPKKIDWD